MSLEFIGSTLQAMLEINDQMHKIWKNQVEEKSIQSSISSWIMNLPFDTKVKEWLAAEEQYKQEVHMKNILPAVADKFLIDGHGKHRGASLLCFDEIQVFFYYINFYSLCLMVASIFLKLLHVPLQTVDVFAIVALSGILSRLLSTGTILVATSNRAPEDLNQVL